MTENHSPAGSVQPPSVDGPMRSFFGILASLPWRVAAAILGLDPEALAACKIDERRRAVRKAFAVLYSAAFTSTGVAVACQAAGFSTEVAIAVAAVFWFGIVTFDADMAVRTIAMEARDLVTASRFSHTVRDTLHLVPRVVLSVAMAYLVAQLLALTLFHESIEAHRAATEQSDNASIVARARERDEARRPTLEEAVALERDRNAVQQARRADIEARLIELPKEIAVQETLARCESKGFRQEYPEQCEGASGVPGEGERHTFVLGTVTALKQEATRLGNELAGLPATATTTAQDALHAWVTERDVRIVQTARLDPDYVVSPDTLLHGLSVLYDLVDTNVIAKRVVLASEIVLLGLDMLALLVVSRGPLAGGYAGRKGEEEVIDRAKRSALLAEEAMEHARRAEGIDVVLGGVEIRRHAREQHFSDVTGQPYRSDPPSRSTPPSPPNF